MSGGIVEFIRAPVTAIAAAIERATMQERNRLFVELRVLARLFGENPGRFADLYRDEWERAAEAAAAQRRRNRGRT